MRSARKGSRPAPIKVSRSESTPVAVGASIISSFGSNNSPEVEEVERLQTRDGVWNGADGVVVEHEPLHRVEVGALLRQLGQLVARHI